MRDFFRAVLAAAVPIVIIGAFFTNQVASLFGWAVILGTLATLILGIRALVIHFFFHDRNP